MTIQVEIALMLEEPVARRFHCVRGQSERV